ncbi:cation channel sperm-associated targeting subunit tau [Cavia porcellus]|uniref:cation channel sperm-associated targeting subunit tau n=1 Tax=Cavia porcellus TaxID=10141 RepID=UPI002FE30F33
MCKKENILFAEDIEYEDQDPPYTASSKTAESPSTISYPITIAKTVSDTKKLSFDPATNTINTLDSQNKLANNANIAMKTPHSTLKEGLRRASLPSFTGETSMIKPENKRHLSKSLSSPSHVENLKQLEAIKSILSKSLQNLSDTLLGKSEIRKNTQVIDKSSSAFLNIHKKPSHRLEDEVFKSLQDLDTWLSEKHILNSKSLLYNAIKSISADLQSEGKSGKSLEVKEHDSAEHLDASEIKIPMKKKSSFKRKHLLCEIPSSKSGVHSHVHDCVIKEIFTASIFSQLEAGVKELSKTQMKQQERSLSSKILLHSGDEDAEKELPCPHSAISQIIQTLPVNAVLESGISKVIELGKEHEMQPPLHTASAGEELQDGTVDSSGIQSKIKPPPGQKRPVIPQAATAAASGVEPTEGNQDALLRDSKYHSTPHKKPYGISKDQSLDRRENDLNSTLESLRDTLMGTFNESEAITLTSLSKSIFNVFFKPNQSERRRQPGEELETLILHSYPSDTEYLEKIRGNFNKAGRKPFLSRKLHRFLENLSESEIKDLKFELSKHIQHYLIEKLAESGHIPKEDLPKIYQNLYLMHENTKLKGQNIFQDKYSETVKEIVSFINNLKINFIDKNLGIKLRSFLNEILQNYLLKDYSESSLLTETESAPTTHSTISSPRANSTSRSFSELGQDISTENFDRRLEVSMKYPLDKSLQNYLTTLTETELLTLKQNLSRQLQSIFIEKLLKSGLLTKKQLKEIIQSTNLLNSSSGSSKYIKTDLPFRGESGFIEENLEKQNKCLKTSQSTTAQNITEDEHIQTEFIRKEEKEYSSSHNLKEKTSTVWQQKNDYSREGSKALSLTKTQLNPNTIQALPLNILSERLTNVLLKKHKKEYGFRQPPRAEISMYRTETQDSYRRDGKSEAILSKVCFKTTLKANPVETREHINTCTLTLQKHPEAILSRIPYCHMPRDSEDHLNSSAFPLEQAHTSTHLNFETKEQATFDQYIQRLRENNNNNKKHLITFGHYKKAIQTLCMSQDEICDECVQLPESQSFKYKGYEETSNSFFFSELLKRENIKPKVQKERKCGSKSKKSSNNIGRLLPNTLPSTAIHVRKPAPKTLLHWTARTTIHDCLDKYEDFYGTPPKQSTKTKLKTRLVRKNSECSHHQGKPAARPYTAPEPNKQESYTGKFPNPRMVSAGLIHINDTTLDHTMCNMRPPKIKRKF